MTQPEKSARERGREAHVDGLDFASNPFQPHGDEVRYQAWRHAWLEAARQGK